MGNPLSTHTEVSTKLITAHQAHHCDDHARSQSRDKVSLPKHRAPQTSKGLALASGAGFWQLTFAFVCGGLFFATVTATAGAVYDGFGIDNVKRGLRAAHSRTLTTGKFISTRNAR